MHTSDGMNDFTQRKYFWYSTLSVSVLDVIDTPENVTQFTHTLSSTGCFSNCKISLFYTWVPSYQYLDHQLRRRPSRTFQHAQWLTQNSKSHLYTMFPMSTTTTVSNFTVKNTLFFTFSSSWWLWWSLPGLTSSMRRQREWISIPWAVVPRQRHWPAYRHSLRQ